MKKITGICTVFLIGLLCTGCSLEHREEVSIEPSSVLETKSGGETTDIPQMGSAKIAGNTDVLVQETPVSIQVFASEDVKVTPEIVEYDFEGACEMGEKQQIYGMLPGASEGIWYIVTVDGVEYYYGRYDFSADRTELFGYAIVSGEHSLANGISVGMTKNEVIELYPAMAMLDMENNSLNGVVGHMGWNSTAYPCSSAGMDEKLQYADGKEYRWDNQFDYVMIADVEQPSDILPVYAALMMKDDIVSAITFYYPTAG